MYIYKKRNIYSILIIILSIFICNKNTKAEMVRDSFSKSFISSFHYVDNETSKWGSFEKFIRDDDGLIAYCIEPGVSFNNKEYEGFSNLSNKELAVYVNLNETNLIKITEIAYFGWGYKRHLDDEWIVATQALIWKYLGRNFSFTSKNNESNPWAYVIDTPNAIKEKMEEIENLVNSYENNVSFNKSFIKIPLNSNYEIVDSNKQLNNYQILNCLDCEAHINNNSLFIKPTRKSGKIELGRKMNDWNSNFIVYYHSNSQNLLIPGNIPNINAELSYQVVSGKLKLKKYDQDNKVCKSKENGSLAGSIYKLYKDNNEYVTDLIINDNCEAEIDNLELGKYYILESKAGLNYELDLEKHYFDLTINEPYKELIVYDKMYLGQISIEKVDSKNNSCKPSSSYANLEGAIYGIYKKDNTLISSLTIGKNCLSTSKRNLLLGEYYLKEIKAPTGYQLDPEKYYFSITKENASEIIKIKIKEKIYETNLIIHKTYYSEIGFIEESGATFDIYSVKNGLKITSITTNKNGIAKIILPYGEYLIRQVKGQYGYKFIEDITFEVNEKTDKDSYLKLVNEPFLGKLIIKKIDNNTKKYLTNALFEIFDKNGRFITMGRTGNNGEMIVENLRFGKYYIVEKEAPKGYAKQEEPIYFEINELQQIINLTIPNEQKIKVPNTKLNRDYRIISLNIILLIIGIKIYKNEKNSL